MSASENKYCKYFQGPSFQTCFFMDYIKTCSMLRARDTGQ